VYEGTRSIICFIIGGVVLWFGWYSKKKKREELERDLQLGNYSEEGKERQEILQRKLAAAKEKREQEKLERELREKRELQELLQRISPEVRNDIEKYYKSKDEWFQSAITIVLFDDNTRKINDNYITNEIKRLSNVTFLPGEDLTEDEKREEQQRMRNMKIFYEDIRKFQEYFLIKKIKLTLNKIADIFQDVRDKIYQEWQEQNVDKIYRALKERISVPTSQQEIVKKYILYLQEFGELENLTQHRLNLSPHVLTKFGFPYENYTDELNAIFLEVFEELIAEGFEGKLYSVYDGVAPDTDMDFNQSRNAISSDTKREVWRRDQGRCVKCGSRENLEYDHIIPVSKGGSNTARNIELLCQTCNRKKSAQIL